MYILHVISVIYNTYKKFVKKKSEKNNTYRKPSVTILFGFTTARSVFISLQYMQMHQLGAVLPPDHGCSGSPLYIVSRMSIAKEGRFAHTCLTAAISPYISMFEMHFGNANYLLDSDM